MLDLSIVVPVAKGDNSWPALLQQLSGLSLNIEVVIAACEDASQDEKKSYQAWPANFTCKVVYGPSGRARQLNHGFHHCSAPLIWFLHADTSLDNKALEKLGTLVHTYQDALYFFDLKFQKEKRQPMVINEWGVYIRSHILKLPFGDQGFLLSKSLLKALGGFNDQCPYGEDHLLVWRCHQQGIPVKAVGASLTTSARKYEAGGWLHTTGLHLRLTLKQALPELNKLLRSKCKNLL